jgi:hypothetical protein
MVPWAAGPRLAQLDLALGYGSNSGLRSGSQPEATAAICVICSILLSWIVGAQMEVEMPPSTGSPVPLLGTVTWPFAYYGQPRVKMV